MTEFVLEVLDGESRGHVISLARERLTLGRRPNNDVVLKDEKASGTHAEVVREGEAWVLRDLDSRNGTFLDGRKVSELSLSPGDVFKIGLTALCFRRAEDAAAAAAVSEVADGLSVHRIDQARLQRVKRGGGMLGMVLALVAVVGAAGWVWFRYGGERGAAAANPRAARHVVPGNQLTAEAATLDDEAAWDTGAAGAGFTVGGPAHSGGNALVASGEGATAPFALARVKEPLRVLGDDVLEVSAQVHCEAGAAVALRLQFSSSHPEETLTLLASTPPSTASAWEKLAAELVVPPGLDRARVEVVALLPSAAAVARVDDVAVVRRGGGASATLTAHNGRRMLVSGASAAMVLAQDVLLQGVRPLPAADGPLAALDAAAGASLAEAGGTLSATVDGDRFTLRVAGVDGYALEFPTSDGLLLRAAPDQPFVATPAYFTGRAVELLIGGGNTRLMLAAAAPVDVEGRAVANGYRVQWSGAGELGLTVGFEEERRQARELLRAARDEAQAGRFATALGPLQKIAGTFPHDDAVLAEAQQLRAEILAGLSAKLDRLAQDLDTAKFFAARSGLVRVLSDLDDLERDYGADNLGRPDLVQRVRTEAGDLVGELDAQQLAQRAAGLHRLSEAMQQAGNTELSAVIDGYLQQHERKN